MKSEVVFKLLGNCLLYNLLGLGQRLIKRGLTLLRKKFSIYIIIKIFGLNISNFNGHINKITKGINSIRNSTAIIGNLKAGNTSSTTGSSRTSSRRTGRSRGALCTNDSRVKTSLRTAIHNGLLTVVITSNFSLLCIEITSLFCFIRIKTTSKLSLIMVKLHHLFIKGTLRNSRSDRTSTSGNSANGGCNAENSTYSHVQKFLELII